MPLYLYYCPKCNEFVEHIVPSGTRDYQKCRKCDAHLEPQISVPAKRVSGFAGKGGGLPENWGRE